jgi:prepilin-type N-terminal cleavage/methylation domain-containing protein/prepilin-type processing-associated H-X9-DG protein
MKRPNGFTLLELLVVLALLLLLASILFPVFRSVKDRADQTKCVSHLRSIGLAMQLYAMDHDDTAPIGAYHTSGAVNGSWDFTWHDALSWNVRDWGPFFCPAAPSGITPRWSYGANRFVSGYRWAQKLAAIPIPAAAVFATEKAHGDFCFYVDGEQGQPHWQPLTPRHSGKVMVLFLDGHIDPLRPQDLVVAQVPG